MWPATRSGSLSPSARLREWSYGGHPSRFPRCAPTREGWSRWRESNPRFGLTKTADSRCPTPALVGAVGVEPTSRSRRDRGLPLTYAPWSGSGDLHTSAPAPQAGGTLSSLEPVEGAAGVAPALAEPRSAVQSSYTSPPK